MSKKHLHNQAAIPLAPAVFKVRFNFFSSIYFMANFMFIFFQGYCSVFLGLLFLNCFATYLMVTF